MIWGNLTNLVSLLAIQARLQFHSYISNRTSIRYGVHKDDIRAIALRSLVQKSLVVVSEPSSIKYCLVCYIFSSLRYILTEKLLM